MEFINEYLRKELIRSIVKAALKSALSYVEKFDLPKEEKPFSEPLIVNNG